ncbi:MAG: NlpC/P60 family protein [Fusobacteria bacterium]|nr:NlpC/P60 family protein [Fusobacteriota bacterium]
MNVFQKLSDIAELSQNFETYFLKESETSVLAEMYLSRYYSVWCEKSENSVLEKMENHWSLFSNKNWCGENLLKQSEAFMTELKASIDRESFLEKSYCCVVTRASNLRILPTHHPLFETELDYPFDMIQESMVPYSIPIKIYGKTKSGRFLFAKTSSENYAWIEACDVAKIEEKDIEWLTSHQNYRVVTQDSLPLYYNFNYCAELFVGSIVAISHNNAVVPLKNEITGMAHYVEAEIDLEKTDDFPMKYCKKNCVKILNKLIRQPYDWGGKYQGRDCSSTMKDYFACLGYFINRNSKDQVKNGNFFSLEGLNKSEKVEFIVQNGIPFRTILHRPGHVMLYLGMKNKRVIIFHQFWRTIVSTGEESLNYHEHASHITYLDSGIKHLGDISPLFEMTCNMMVIV